MKEVPDGWIVLKLSKENSKDVYKVFASWLGGYLGGDSWKLNSGIKRVEETDGAYTFHGFSGSEYICKKKYYGVSSGYASSILNSLIDTIIKNGHDVEELYKSFDYLKLNETI